MATDIRDEIFKNIMDKEFSAIVTAERSGILSGVTEAINAVETLGLKVDYYLQDSSPIVVGEKLLLLRGNPKQIAQAEEVVVGTMSMASGIATAAQSALTYAGSNLRIVAGAWKKMPPVIKQLVRNAIVAGGGKFRITDSPFIYMDKNYVRMFGGIQAALHTVVKFKDMCKCIQLKGETASIEIEAEIAVKNGADIIMVDTGSLKDVEQVLDHLVKLNLRELVKVAFGNGIKLDDIPLLATKGIDILDIGLQIIDAPLLDMKFDVVPTETIQQNMLEVNLFEKTELIVNGICLESANLNDLATIVAQTLNIDVREVLVIDVQNESISLDILKKKINLSDIAGKEQLLLSNLAKLDNVILKSNCSVHSEGILGIIAIDAKDTSHLLKRFCETGVNIQSGISHRAKVFPTGFELINGYIKDTNSPLIQQKLQAVGFKVSIGEILDDDVFLIQKEIMTAINDGYGLIITTGGTGAEGKDCTIEAVLNIDKQAATPYILKFQQGNGRHIKNGVRIAVGELDGCLIVSLPGPNSEVNLAINTLIPMLNKHGKKELASAIADALRLFIKDKFRH